MNRIDSAASNTLLLNHIDTMATTNPLRDSDIRCQDGNSISLDDPVTIPQHSHPGAAFSSLLQPNSDAIVFGPNNSGFQAGKLYHSKVSNTFNLAPGELPIIQGYMAVLTAARPQSDQRLHRTRRSSYPSVATQISSSEGYSIKFTRNALFWDPEPRLLA
jgi:hypothetical protein